VQCASVGTTKTGSYPTLTAQRLADGATTGIDLTVSKVLASATLPAKVYVMRTKPLPSRTSPSVTSGQSLRFSFERPRFALPLV